MAVATAQLGGYLDAFSAFSREGGATAHAWLRDLRETAFARFCAVGFPTTRDEDWRFTNLSSLARTPFRLARSEKHSITADDLDQWLMEGAGARLVFVDGQFARELSSFD